MIRLTTKEPPDPSTITVRDFYTKVYKPRRLVGCSQRTHQLYLVSLKHFDDHFGRLATLADFNDDVMTTFAAEHSEGRSPATVNKSLNQLLALWRYAASKRYVWDLREASA